MSGWIAVPIDAPPVRVRLDAQRARGRGRLGHEPTIRSHHRAPAKLGGSTCGYATSGRTRARRSTAGHGRGSSRCRSSVTAPGWSPTAASTPCRRLQEKMANGYVFGQTGRLQLSKKHDTAWQTATMGLYQEVREIVAQRARIRVFVFYGTLLGAVREGTVIGHDVDFDAAYVSTLSNPRAAALELQALGLLLVDRGFQVRCAHTSLHIYAGTLGNQDRRVPHLLRTPGRALLALRAGGHDRRDPEQMAGVDRDRVLRWPGAGPGQRRADGRVAVRSGWRSPQPGFDWARERTKRDWPGVLSVDDVQEVYWADFYAHHEIEGGSAFFETVRATRSALDGDRPRLRRRS